MMASERTMEGKNKGSSVNTTLTALLSVKTNKMCADCRAALVDPLLVQASFCPSQDEIRQNPQIAVAIHDFAVTHQAFAPPDVKEDTKQFPSDPASFVNQKFGGHGVFLCVKCADVHKFLGSAITVVLPVLGDPLNRWTQERANFMESCGGNERSWTVYEAYMPEQWKLRRPKPSSTQEERLLFVRAKYEALAFAMPPPGKLSEYAWLSILERNKTAKRFISPELKNIHSLTPSHAPTTLNQKKFTADDSSVPLRSNELPNRLIDFFCVVDCSMQLHPNEIRKDLSKLTSPEELAFWPQVCDCYPELDAHIQDMEFPGHLPSFVLPEGCRPSLVHKTPSFFTFVLTTGLGDRLYGGSLQIYDQTKGIEEVREAMLSSGYKGKLPGFLEERDKNNHEIVFFSKSLVLLSHYPFFDLFRNSLKQLNMLTLIEAPLPIERYISNLCREIPLPPQGRIRVEFSFTPGKIIAIDRPPSNELPMAKFSYRPLFSALSVSNIMIVMGCLMEECKVVLLSHHYSVLCPVAEALLSALFPFRWQGLYIPILPYAMMDILDAPVPFLVGMTSRYLTEIEPKTRPRDLVFVDLDRDVVQLGIDDATGYKRKIPSLPSRDAAKLKVSLDEHGGSAYMLPNSGIKGCVMSGIAETILVVNDERPRYARMENVRIDEDALGRRAVFDRTEKAYDEEKDFAEIQVQGHMKSDSDDLSVKSGDSTMKDRMQRARDRLKTKQTMFSTSRSKKEKLLSSSNRAGDQGHLLDVAEPGGFNSREIRKAFLRFFVTLFVDYKEYLLTESLNDMFDEETFLKDLHYETYSRDFMERVIQTQMFQRFLEEREENPMDPQIRFFDESIIAKLNRSKKTTLANGGKKVPTPFIDDESETVTKTFTPPPPSNLGLPDNESTYQYGTFPELDLSLFGRPRPATVWRQERSFNRSSMRFKSFKLSKAQKTQRDVMKKAVMKPDVTKRITDATRQSVTTLEGALTSITPKLGFMSPRSADTKDKTLSTRSANKTDKKKMMKDVSKKDKQNKGKIMVKQELKTETSDLFSESNSSGDLDSLPESIVVPLSRADTIIMNARRKQAILLDVVIKIQATCRMYLIKKQYVTGKRPQREGLNFRSATSIQRCFRGRTARRMYASMRICAILIQTQVRGRKARLIYILIQELVAKVQARVRGVLVRNRIALVFSGRMNEYRTQIFALWKYSFVPLSLRTKLWPTISSSGNFARLSLCECEVLRLVKLGGLTLETNASFNDRTTKVGDSLGLENDVYRMCKQVPVLLTEISQEISPPSLQTAEGYEQAERLQLYEHLDSKNLADKVGDLYELFGIAAKEKRKKERLAQSIWNHYDQVEKSVSTMMQIFPELEGALNIAFHYSSSKVRRRFAKATKVETPPVERSLWDEISLEGKMKKHMQEVASIYITAVPALMAKLDEAYKKKNSMRERYVQAMMQAYNTSTWSQCRQRMIEDYLSHS